MIRAKKVNELYYARDNNPSFYQFKKNYHFIDSEERQYMIAVKNKQVFQNTRFKNKNTQASMVGKVLEPVITNYGFTKLYVKLANPTSTWFTQRDINKVLILYDKSQNAYQVVLKSHEKHNVSRRTGTIYVKGLNKVDLLTLLNAER